MAAEEGLYRGLVGPKGLSALLGLELTGAVSHKPRWHSLVRTLFTSVSNREGRPGGTVSMAACVLCLAGLPDGVGRLVATSSLTVLFCRGQYLYT